MKRSPRPAPELPPDLEALRLGRGRVLFVYSLHLPELPETLTAAEREVVLLALRGHDNRSIARARGSSPRTVANLMARAFRRLGVASRAELAARLVAP